MAKGTYTRASLIAKASDKTSSLANLQRAVDYAVGHKLGAWKVAGLNIFPGVTRNKLQKALNGQNKRLAGGRKATDILTKDEELKLVEWMKSSARGKDPATDAEVSEKVVIMLKARRAEHKKNKHGKGTVALTPFEERLAVERGAEVSKTWIQGLAGRHPTLDKKKERNADATRTKKQNEGVVEKHFFGEYGIQASLESIGLIDMKTKMITDPRSVWWFDEMGQALDAANQGPRSSAWGIKGEKLERAGAVNRETASIGMAFNLAGFLAGPQINVGRENWTCALADCLDAPAHAKSFDSQIYPLDMKSTFCLMSKTANGVQTQESFMQFLRGLRTQVEAYSKMEEISGRPPITFPIWLGTDNHTSRFSAEVLEACTPMAANELGIRLFFEEAKTSQFLQPPDQVTKLCHQAYTRGKKLYQKLHKKVYGAEAKITIVEFTEIWGGCRELGYEGAWFSWCNAQILLDAWRRCGWLGCLIAPEEIDRTSFIDQQPKPPPEDAPPTPKRLTFEEACTTPPDVRSGTLAAEKAKNAQMKTYIEQNTHAPFDPVAAGLLVPKVKEPTKRARDKTRIDESEGGDAWLRGLALTARAKQLTKTAKVLQVAANKEASAAKKAQEQQEYDKKKAAFLRCQPACVCGVRPCPQAKLHLCEICGDIKSNVCRKAACIAAGAPLAITMREPAAPALAEEAAPPPPPAEAGVPPPPAQEEAQVMFETNEGFIPLATAAVERPRRENVRPAKDVFQKGRTRGGA